MIEESEVNYLKRINELIHVMGPSADILQQACDSLHEITGMLGFNTFTYVGGRLLAGHKITGWKTNARPITLTNIPGEFREIYSDNRLDTSDPVLRHCFHTLSPKEWSKIYTANQMDHKEQRFIELSLDFDMKDGIAFPIHGPGNDYGILSLSAPRKVSIPDVSLVAMTNLFSQRLHTSIRESFDHCEDGNSFRLAAREIDVLYWCAEGKTAWEIGQILGISDRTVEKHLQMAKSKLGATTTAQAIAKAMTIRFIEPL